MLRKARIMLLTLLLTAVSCNSDFTYSSYPCYLVIDNSIHQNSTLASAMNAVSPGVFCTIAVNEARKQYVFTNSHGQKSEANFTAVDLRLSRQVGMNDAVIVGFGSLSNQFYAFDRECPMCFSPDAIPVRSRPLAIGEDGMATCSVCKRQYNMNTGGNCISEGGVKGMTLYHASTTGPYGTLAVR